jgi:TonB-dependent SusC/RagA subfamily outer membrane receptor
MPAIFIYLLKLSVSLGVVFLFYQFVLRRLTFYNWNRWYLLGYTLLSFIIPFIDITPVLHRNDLNESVMVDWVPVFYAKNGSPASFTGWNLVSLFFVTGIAIMGVRLLIQLLSFRKMMKKAKLISAVDINLYQVNEYIIPFSFGNAVFINRHQHSPEELEEIIRHEYVHVKQRHSVDIVFGEIICLLNWYNPFAWLIRKAIRQNLEFIADNKVLQNGMGKQAYQYLLLKVIGNNQFSIATSFNFSSLKKRIAMMNKIKSAKTNLLRFLFMLPVLAVVLVSFRKQIENTLSGKRVSSIVRSELDTLPEALVVNKKGYAINVQHKEGQNFVVVKDAKGVEIKRMLLSEWGKEAKRNESIYGEVPPPPPPVVIAVEGLPLGIAPPPPPAAPAPPAPVKLPANIQKITINNDNATVVLKNGQSEKYNLNNDAEKAKFDVKYGEFVPPPPPAPPAQGIYIPGLELKKRADNAAPQGDPTYVLDGEEIKKEKINEIEPSTIESINVLKGSAAEAAYGDKGKNGVIIIKTKKKEAAKPNQPKISNLFLISKDDGC